MIRFAFSPPGPPIAKPLPYRWLVRRAPTGPATRLTLAIPRRLDQWLHARGQALGSRLPTGRRMRYSCCEPGPSWRRPACGHGETVDAADSKRGLPSNSQKVRRVENVVFSEGSRGGSVECSSRRKGARCSIGAESLGWNRRQKCGRGGIGRRSGLKIPCATRLGQ